MAYLLIVDDDEDFADAVAKLIKSLGHEVDIESRAQNAISRMEARIPDLVILDVMFPESNIAGFELAEKIHASEKLKNVRIILLTAVNEKIPYGFSTKSIDSKHPPIDDLVEKPVDLSVLKRKITQALERK